MTIRGSLAFSVCLMGLAVPVVGQSATAGVPGRPVMFVREEFARLSVGQGAETASPAWERVRKLAAGAEIIVTTRDSQHRTGYFAGASESQLYVKTNRTGPATDTLARQDVVEVARSVSLSRKGALIGLAVGAAAGVGYASNAHRGYGNVAAAAAGVFGGAGAGVGALIGAFHHRTEVIYRAP